MEDALRPSSISGRELTCKWFLHGDSNEWYADILRDQYN